MIPAKKLEQPAPSTIEAVLMKGDLSRLTEEQRLEYYNQTCKSLGLNPLTRPFEYITLNGKLTLYARKDATDQLRRLNSISVEVISQDFDAGLLTVHVRAKDRDGRTDEDIGSVAFPETLKGEIAANMRMKAVTKAKRRVTLSICGLGFLDETEVEDIPASVKQVPPTQTDAEKITHAQISEIAAFAESIGANLGKLCEHLDVVQIADLPASKYAMAMEALENYEVRKKERNKIESGLRK